MRTVETAEGSVQRHSTAQGCFAWLEQQLETFRVRDTVAAATALPFDFWGGYVGYLGCARCAFTLSMHDVVPVEGWDVAPGNTPHSTFPLEGVGVRGCANTPGWVLRDTARPCFWDTTSCRKAAPLTLLRGSSEFTWHQRCVISFLSKLSSHGAAWWAALDRRA